MIMFKKKHKKKEKEKKKLRKLMLSNQDYLVNVVEKEEDVKIKRLQCSVYLPDELISEIISLLSIKTIFRLKCVSKSWDILISDPTFVQKHLKYSSQNPRLILTPKTWLCHLSSIVSISVHCLLENPSSTVSPEYYHCWVNNFEVIGTYKGLLCLLFRYKSNVDRTCSFCLWNPATRTKSGEFGTFQDNTLWHGFDFRFVCDISTGTYKVVAFRGIQDRENQGSLRSQVRIFSLTENCWRNIGSFSSIPCIGQIIKQNNIGLHLRGTFNWLTLRNYGYSIYFYKNISYVEQLLIVSLDLSTETYTLFLLPSGFDEVPHFQPNLHVLMDCLCFSHDFKRIEFVIWQMKEFGVQESWTQLFRIDYINLQMDTLPVNNYDMELLVEMYNSDASLLPLYLSKNGDPLILAKCEYRDDQEAIIYNLRDKRVEKIKISDRWSWYSSMDYVESLIWTPSIESRSISSIHDSKIGMIVGGDSREEVDEGVEDKVEDPFLI